MLALAGVHIAGAPVDGAADRDALRRRKRQRPSRPR